MSKYVLFYLFLFIIGCSKKEAHNLCFKYDFTANLVAEWKAEIPNPGFTIKNAIIKEDCLEITIQSGGCSGNSWQADLIGSISIIKTLPPIRPIRFRLDNKEMCYALITKTYLINLEALRDTGSGKKIFLDLEGWDKNLLYTY